MPVLEYLTLKKREKQDTQTPQTPKTPMLNEEDELFLKKFTSDEIPPPLPARPVVILDNGQKVEGRDAQLALMDGAEKVALPMSPPVEDASMDKKGKGKAKADGDKKSRDYWSFVPGLDRMKSMRKKKAGDDLQSAADAIKSGKTPVDQEAEKEKEDLTAILDQLNLAAVNNRVFSFTKESQELMEKFKQVLKDLINGVPTAYDDLEKLLTNSEKQLSTTFAAMPPFIQALIKSLPSKVTSSLGPEVMAATAEKPSISAAGASTLKKAKRSYIPSLKSLVSEKGAVVTMLRSIINFLKLRFPAVISGTNILLSVAIFLLLFVFWYCHKRGRETRLEKERLAAEGGDAEGSESDASALEDSTIEEATRQAKQQAKEEEASGKSPMANLDDLPSVLDLPSPSEMPLPATPQPKSGDKKL